VIHFAEQKWETRSAKATTGCANQKPGRAARLICLVKDINFKYVNRLNSYKHSHL